VQQHVPLAWYTRDGLCADQTRLLQDVCPHFQQLLTAMALHSARVIAWLEGEPAGECRWQPGYGARVAPHPLSGSHLLW